MSRATDHWWLHRGARIAAVLLALGAAGCGGGGGDSGAGGSNSSAAGALSVSIAGGATAGVRHVWVTITSVALHADAQQPWSAIDSTWQVVRFDAPVTLDLLSLVNGTNHPLVIGQALPAGSYGQMRLFLLAHDAPLAQAAHELQLSYNDEVDRTLPDGTTQALPLELPDTRLGLRLDGPVIVHNNDHADVTVQWDAERTLVPFDAGGGTLRYTVRPELQWYDVSNSGAIIGLIDRSQFCADGAPADNCIHDVVASALLTSADGRIRRSVRSTPVTLGPQYASFGLYPLPALAAGARFDVVIRGHNMRTMVVRNVPAAPAGLLEALPTSLSDNPDDPTRPIPLVPVLQAGGDGVAMLAAPLAAPAAQLVFTRTLPGDSVPLEVAVANVDPFSGLLAEAALLPGGPLRVASYQDNAAPVFSDVTPAEGDDGYQAVAFGTRYDDAGAAVPLTVVPGGSSSFTAADPARHAGVGSGTLSVALSGGSAAQFDAAELVISDANGIVATRDVAALIGSSGSVDIALPAGAGATAQGGTAVYTVALRAWKRGTPTSAQWVRASALADLRSASSASVTLTLP